jgi:hypothetical protein
LSIRKLGKALASRDGELLRRGAGSTIGAGDFLRKGVESRAMAGYKFHTHNLTPASHSPEQPPRISDEIEKKRRSRRCPDIPMSNDRRDVSIGTRFIGQAGLRPIGPERRRSTTQAGRSIAADTQA